jgi:ribosomal protein S12 methylthiotransferase
MLARLTENHFLTNEISNAEIIVINTCAFLKQARKEAIEQILLAIEEKKNNTAEKIIVTGCLPQKWSSDLYSELSEVDAFLGVSDYERIDEAIDRIYNNERIVFVSEPKNISGTKRVLTTKDYAYLKIADGCFNHCTYCLIPYIRGKYRSVREEELIKEAKSLGDVKELILVAQDVTSYGKDLGQEFNLVRLIQKLSALETVCGIRLLYCYPEGVTEELLKEFFTNPKMIRYIDIPMQHASDSVLKRMGRKGTFKEYLDLIERLKKKVKGIAIRSTFITGFPGETEEDFNILKDFITKAELNNAGFFKYSREEGTTAYKLDNQLSEKIKNSRLKKLYTLQKRVVKKLSKGLIGKIFSVTVEGFDFNLLTYFGRAYFNAPDIDGKIYFFSGEELTKGQTVNVKILKAEDYDLFGEKL